MEAGMIDEFDNDFLFEAARGNVGIDDEQIFDSYEDPYGKGWLRALQRRD
jgi:hypothetical protein